MSGPLVHQLYAFIQARPSVLRLFRMLFGAWPDACYRKSIEVLPANWNSEPANPHKPFEFQDGNLGIPKGTFYEAYSHAIREFNGFLNQGMDLLDEGKTNDLLQSTCVVLLVNPAHITCLNRRKHLVETGRVQEKEELQTIASLQLLPEGAKSSILWHHRRWLLRRIYQKGDILHTVDRLDECSIPLDDLSQEISITTTASEVYPRNYHSWLHRQKCMRSIVAMYRRAPEKGGSPPREALAQVLRAEEFAITKWIDLNISDLTAMQYLCQLYDSMEEVGVDHMQVHLESEDTAEELQIQKVPFSPLDHAIDLVQRYPTHEALWYYLRAAYFSHPKHGNILDNIRSSEGVYADRFKRWRNSYDNRRGHAIVT